MQNFNKKTGTVCKILIFTTTVVVCQTMPTELSLGQEIGGKVQALTTAVPVAVGELEAVGTIPRCTATLITNNLVLTAAHCVCPSENNNLNCETRVIFTLHDVFPVDNPQTSIDESKTRTNVDIAGTVRVHPEYTMRGWLREDYAVIELDQPITEVAHVKPIPVAAPFSIPFEGEILTLVGYGATQPDCKGPSLGKMKMPVQLTVSGWGGLNFKNAKLHSCPGDSGGPALNGDNLVVGVASWSDGEGSTYRPTSFAYNWIYGVPQPRWGSCQWVRIGQGGLNSHQATQLCPDGSFLTALDIDGPKEASGSDAPIIGQARCCNVAGAENFKWASSIWVGVETAGLNSHSNRGSWCPQGSFITGIDLDASQGDALDSPVIGQVQCSKLAASVYSNWGSTYWMDIGPLKSHQAGSEWCLDGAWITQLDLNRDDKADPHDSPIIFKAKCSSIIK